MKLQTALNLIEGREEFRHTKRNGYSVIDYHHVLPDSFENGRDELRGIKFNAEGECIARPFKKFFNVGEKEWTMPYALPFHDRHRVLEKLDGSMVHPMFVNGHMVWCTRAGETEVSEKAPVSSNVIKLSEHALDNNWTPIFEYVGPCNRIVLRYNEERMVLTGLRDIDTGQIMGYEFMCNMADGSGVDYVRSCDSSTSDINAFIAHAKSLKDAEGYVIRWDNGEMVKIKADDYVLRHRSRDELQHEKNVLALICRDAVDDMVPLLSPEDGRTLQAYERTVKKAMNYHAAALENIVHASAVNKTHEGRKRFALEYIPTVKPELRAAAWMIFDGWGPFEAVKQTFDRHTKTNNDVEKIRDLIGDSWSRYYQKHDMEAA